MVKNSPNKRKSQSNEVQTVQTPKKQKLNESLQKTPASNKKKNIPSKPNTPMAKNTPNKPKPQNVKQQSPKKQGKTSKKAVAKAKKTPGQVRTHVIPEHVFETLKNRKQKKRICYKLHMALKSYGKESPSDEILNEICDKIIKEDNIEMIALEARKKENKKEVDAESNDSEADAESNDSEEDAESDDNEEDAESNDSEEEA